MSNQHLIVFFLLALSASTAGCTASQASTHDHYGDYLSEMSLGNTEFALASEHYNNASQYFSKGRYTPAIQEIDAAEKGYDRASRHYSNMTAMATTNDQRAYADALQAYARSCMYASTAYGDAYQAYSTGDNYRGDACQQNAKEYIEQAGKDHARAVALQPNAII
ncbi:hypothetical protein [Methanocella sp. MCL-LM]|uniref:hypothetical protein n=1 Tax=Methanocella sp. MCL-LM TaxID=3412035 RepID=UPI003C73F7F8